ncbi:urea transporter [Marinobacterium aestuarii]|uniref:urea transporter n=1 Tax=Marinobacterium aestuarii TaxID=1821621 RepID=UPI000B165343|nr:urea transporter [Marinobacterium aestuarii]
MNTKLTPACWRDTLLHSFSQVLFQSHRGCGALILLAIGLESITALLGSLLGWGGALLGARLIRADSAMIRAGYYGFNGALVGLALNLLLGLSWFSLACILAFSALSAPLVQLQIRRWRIPPYTSAFVLLSWSAWLLASMLELLPIAAIPDVATSHAAALDTAMADAATGAISLQQWSAGLIRGLGQVFFLGSLPAGLLILAALALSAPRNALWGLAGALLGSLIASLCNVLADTPLFSPQDIAAGLFGYNGALAALALLQRFPRQPAIIIAGVVLATALQPLFGIIGLPAFTAPFVLACWLIVILASILHRQQQKKTPTHLAP